MNNEMFRDIDDLSLRNVCQHLSRFGSFIYLWKTVQDGNLIAGEDAYKLFELDPAPEIFSGSDLEKMVHPEDLDKLRDAEKELLLEKEPTSLEIRFYCGNGSRKTVRLSMELIKNGPDLKILIILLDITEQKRAGLMLDIMNEAFFDLSLELLFRRVNIQAEAFWDKPAREMIGKHILDVFPEMAETPFYETLKSIKNQTEAQRKELIFPLSERWVSVSLASYSDGVIVVFRDISHQKSSEQALLKLNQSLQHKNDQLFHKNAELSSFSFITSNELKAPMRKIYTSFEMILTQEGFKLSNNAKAHFRRIQASLQKMSLITDDLVAFAQVDNIDDELSDTDLNNILQEAKEKIEKQDTNVFQLEKDVLPTVKGYPELLVQLFAHLLNNAVKFQSGARTPQLIIRYEVVQNPSALEFASGSFHRISLQDDGIGFETEHAKSIFNLFFKAHAAREFRGTGVGLAICRKIMEKHRGFITAESSAVGSVFHCFFPFH